MAASNDANSGIRIIPYDEAFYPDIHRMYIEEGWRNLAENDSDTKAAWNQSSIAFIAVTKENEAVACLRGFTDTIVTAFICEMLVEKKFRGLGIGKEFLNYVHNLYPSTRIELLATESSRSFYEEEGYRLFYGFRKSY